MSFRPGLRSIGTAFQPFRNAFRQTISKRWQSAAAPADAAASTAAPKTEKEKLNPFAWDSPVGPKTVHFWAPIMKWALVGATITDFARPAESLSLTQNGALMATGAIWTRWCLIIKPKNYMLAAVNFFLFLANGTQVARYVNYQRSQSPTTLKEDVKDAAERATEKTKDAAERAKEKTKDAVAKVS